MSSSRPEKVCGHYAAYWHVLIHTRKPQIHKTISDFGPGNVAFLDDDSDSDSEDSGITIRSLVKPFVIKQWIHKGKLYAPHVLHQHASTSLIIDGMRIPQI